MASFLKVDQIQSDSGTINVASNIGTAGNFAITGNLTASGMSSPTGTMTISSDMSTTGNVSVNGKATINSDGRQFSVSGAGTTLYEDYKCRAWVNFNGTGTVAIRSSGNVSSITDNGTGNYTVNFTTAMPDANYALSVNAVATMNGRTADASPFFGGAYSTTAVQVFTKDSADITIDSSIVNVSIFR